MAKAAKAAATAKKNDTDKPAAEMTKEGLILVTPFKYDPKRTYPETPSGWAHIIFDTERYVSIANSDLRIKISVVRPKSKPKKEQAK